MAQPQDYPELIRRILGEMVETIRRQHDSSRDGVETLCIFDDQRKHYLLLRVGWNGARRVRAINIHVRIRDDKIWIEEDWTEPCMTDRLLEAGVSPEKIVLGFQPPEHRHLELVAGS